MPYNPEFIHFKIDMVTKHEFVYNKIKRRVIP